MDFGIAARLSDGADGLIVGTAGYMSPEAARGEAPSAGMDVFAAGAMLGELLCGRSLLPENDPLSWLRRVQTEDLQLPAQAQLDDRLRAIVHRAVARDPARRFDSAMALQQALAEWAQPSALAAHSAPAGATQTGHGTLEFLLRRMRHRSDFPALSESVMRIQRVASSDGESLSSLCAEILKDVALTNKLLRMVNTAHYGSAGAGGIGTISRAVSLVGFAGIRNMALSLLLLEQMQNRAHADQLQLEFLRALMAGTLASELAAPDPEREQLFLGAMFQGLGRLLTEFYLPEEALQIRRQLPPGQGPASAHTLRRREAIATQVLGLGFEELGIGVARSWGLPEALLRCMRLPEGEPPPRSVEGAARQRWLCGCANAMTDVLLECGTSAVDARWLNVAERHARALAMPVEAMLAAAASARERFTTVVRALNLHIEPGSAAHRLLATDGLPDDSPEDALSPHPLQATISLAQSKAVPAAMAAPHSIAPPAVDQLAAGMQDISQAMVDSDFDLNQVLRMVLETMYRALGFQRVVFCLLEPKSEMLTGRFGLGGDSAELARHFRVALRAGAAADTDLFAAICRKGADTLIHDARSPSIGNRLPAWYRQHVAAGAFVLLPMVLKGAPFALIYADTAEPGQIQIDEKELSLLRTLRNQAIMAFRQAG
ncbi:MAG: HDOD domain-containing protein, partial [Rubrivivax sp.]